MPGDCVGVAAGEQLPAQRQVHRPPQHGQVPVSPAPIDMRLNRSRGVTRLPLPAAAIEVRPRAEAVLLPRSTARCSFRPHSMFPLDRHPVTGIISSMQESKESPLSPAERQKRYRATRGLVSIDVGREVTEQLNGLRGRTGMTTDALISASLAAFAASLDNKPPPAARRARSDVLAGASPTPRATKLSKPRAPDQERRRQHPSPGDSGVNAAVRGKRASPIAGRHTAKRAQEEGEAEASSTAVRRRRPSRRAPGFKGNLDLFGDEDV